MIDPAELAALIETATEEDLRDGGRYFSNTFADLTRCWHGDTGEYQRLDDGRLVEFLWNHRAEILVLARASIVLKDMGLPIPLPLDSGPLRERAAKADL